MKEENWLKEVYRLKETLENDFLKVIEIDGGWGVGKTYMLNQFVEKYKNPVKLKINSEEDENFNILKIPYSAIKDSDLKKILLFEKRNFDENKNMIAKATEKTVAAFADSELKGLGKLATDFGQYLINKDVENECHNNTIIIIDEIERFADKIDFQSFLISIFELKENFNKIKIILSLNKNKLNEKEKLIWEEWSDKIIDFHFDFRNEESFDICINNLNLKLNKSLETKSLFLPKDILNGNIRYAQKAVIEMIDRFKPFILDSDYIGFREDYLNIIIKEICISIRTKSEPDLIYLHSGWIYGGKNASSFSMIDSNVKNFFGFNYFSENVNNKKQLDENLKLIQQIEGKFLNKTDLSKLIEQADTRNNFFFKLEDIFSYIKKDNNIQFEINKANLYFRKEIQDKFLKSRSIIDNGTDFINRIKGNQNIEDYIQYCSKNLEIVNFGEPTNNGSLNFNFMDIIFNLNYISNEEKNKYINDILDKKIKSFKREIELNDKEILKVKDDNEFIFLLDSLFAIIEQMDFIKRFLGVQDVMFPLGFKMFKNEAIDDLFENSFSKKIKGIPNYSNLTILKNKEELLHKIIESEKIINLNNIFDIKNDFHEFVSFLIKNNRIDLFIKVYNYLKGSVNNERINAILSKHYATLINNEKLDVCYENEIKTLIMHSSDNPLYILESFSDSHSKPNENSIYRNKYVFIETKSSNNDYSFLLYLGKYSEDFKDFELLVKNEYLRLKKDM